MLSLLSFGAIYPFTAPAVRVGRVGVSPSPPTRWDQTGRLPVQASVLWPGMCLPERCQRPETQFALAVAGLDECPWF